MRATILIAAVLLLTGLAPAWAETSPSPSPPDLAFLQSLAEPLEDSQALPPAVGVPEPQLKTCTVTKDCDGSGSVTCTGSMSCQSTFAGVKCDNVETKCPNFCTISLICQCCDGTKTLSCSSLRGDCQRTSNGISCNGNPVVTCQLPCSKFCS